MKTKFFILLSLILSIGIQAQNLAVSFVTSKTIGSSITLKLKVVTAETVGLDLGDGVIENVSVTSTATTSFTRSLTGNTVKVYSNNLNYFECASAEITSVDLTNAIKLTNLYLTINLLTSIDISHLTLLQTCGLANNKLSTLDVTLNTKLNNLYVQNSQLEACELNRIFTDLPIKTTGTFNCKFSGNSGALKSNTAILTAKNWIPDVTGDASGCQPIVLTTSKSVADTINLQLRLAVAGNAYVDFGGGKQPFVVGTTSTPVSGELSSGNTISIYNDNLNYINCENNALVNVDVSDALALQQLYCGYNSLTALDVTNNTNLTRLGCNNNQITTLSLLNNTKLSGMYFQNNLFTACELNEIYGEIPTRATMSENVDFRVTENPGALTSNTAIATGKNWNIDTTGDNTGCISTTLSTFDMSGITGNISGNTIRIFSDREIGKMTLLNVTGKTLHVTYNTKIFTVPNLNTGLYLLLVESKGEKLVLKLNKI